MELPPELDWMREHPPAAAWLGRLDRLTADLVEAWRLRLGPPFGGGHASVVRPARLPGGTEAVLKLQFPSPESDHEADALDRWAGHGAVRLIARDDARHALLIERCVPGTPLWQEESPGAALDVLIGLIPRLWVPAGEPFTPLAAEAARWAAGLPRSWEAAGRPFERRLLDAAVEALLALAPTQGVQVLVHQDLHAGNVLRARRDPWLVIDPKPLAGEREFGVAATVRGEELGAGGRALRYRADRLAVDLGLDRGRVLGWTLGQTLAWGFENGRAVPGRIETARQVLGIAAARR